MSKYTNPDDRRIPISRESAFYQYRGDSTIFVKHLSDSDAEAHIALDLRNRFQHLTFMPNMALSAFLDYDSAKKALPSDLFHYYLTSRVDLLILNGFQPIGAIEIDSSWHDKADSIRRDGMEERILELANFPLVRFRMPEGESYRLSDVDLDELVINIKKALRHG